MPGSDRPRLCRVAGRDTWHIYHQRRRVSTGCTERSGAELVLARYAEDLSRPQLAAISIADILMRYLADRRARGIPGAERLAWAHKPLSRFLGEKPPEAITDSMCRAYASRRRAEGVTEGTSRTELQALRAALRWGERQRLLAAVPDIPLPSRPEPRIRWLTEVEAARLVDACKAHHARLFVQIALNTGARSGAILALTWDRVDLERRLLDFREPGLPRTRKRRVPAPINDTLHAALAEARAVATCEYVVEWGGARVARIKHAFRDACVRAGLPGVTPHVLRHTAVTRALQRGVDPWTVAGFVGMTVEMVQQVYGHHHPDHLRAAARALG